MPVFNFDLEDGEPRVSVTLKPQDAERFVAFMQECDEAKQMSDLWPRLVQRAEQTVRRDPAESDFDLIQRAMRPRRPMGLEEAQEAGMWRDARD